LQMSSKGKYFMDSRDIAIQVKNMSKCYRIGLKEEIRDSFGSALLAFIKSPLNNYRKFRSLYKFDDMRPDANEESEKSSSDLIWALNDISFDIKQGEVFGVIGNNGAGKTTLLKILSKITNPSKGYAKIIGRVASLLEVGTGFHHELTGRENIYLNGTILGMSKKEIDLKFDDIVEFAGAEVGKFIDTPVKRYSSGMEVRLAFSVAAHLEPEILLVDEVLAVGDAAFQKKCIGKMRSVAHEGRTVLFVSHNMGAITQLCGRALWLEKGQIKQCGPSSEVVASYLSHDTEGKAIWSNPFAGPTDKEVLTRSVRLLSKDNQPTHITAFDSSFKVELVYDVLEPIRDLSVVFQLINSQGTLVFEAMDTDVPEWKGHTRVPGKYLAVCEVPGNLLKPDRYYVSVVSFVENVKIIEVYQGVLTFDVSEMGYTLNLGRRGVVSPVLEWQVTRTGRIDGLAENE